MIVLEPWARTLSIAHAVVGATLVGGTTHQLLWCRGYRQGRFPHLAWERRMAAFNALCFVLAFLLGALLYPTYKVRVRVEYFDSPATVAAEAELRREHHLAPAPPERR